jgi:xanthine dehydrogenase accessory factor
MDWILELTALRAKKEPHVLVTVVDSKGSTPRELGVRMIVLADRILGSIGGGNLEFEVTKKSREQLSVAEPGPSLASFSLGASLGQCCGGSVQVFLEPWISSTPPIVVFGAGHVGKALVYLLEGLPHPLIWVDSREEEFPGDCSSKIDLRVSDLPESEVDECPPDSIYVVLTHSHSLDQTLCERILKREDFQFLGMIGSKNKRDRFRKVLLQKGISQENLDRLQTPIGISDIQGKHPKIIAISIAAQILSLP